MTLIRERWPLAALVLVSVLIVIGALMLVGADPAKAMSDLISKTVGDAAALTGTLKEFTPLLIAGTAVFLALRAGLFNIGVEGQLTVGGLACAAVALRVPGFFGIVLGSVAGMAAGGLWALPAGLIKAYRGGHEVITTIMLNHIAFLFCTALVSGVLRDPDQQSPTTASLPEGTWLPRALAIGEFEVSSGLVLAILLAAGLWYWLRSTVSGYELQAVGANPTAAQFAGINHQRVTVKAMAWSGAIAGLAGAVQVLAFSHRFYPSLSSGYGFDALGVALLAGTMPWALLPGAFLFGMLNKGGTPLQVIHGVPKGITLVILGLLIIVAAAVRYRKPGSSDA